MTGPVLLKTVPQSLEIASFFKKRDPVYLIPAAHRAAGYQRANEPAAGGVMP